VRGTRPVRSRVSEAVGYEQMHEMMPGMMWGMGLIGVLIVLVLILAAAALVKYLASGRWGGDRE
jgi:hypothetical protein